MSDRHPNSKIISKLFSQTISQTISTHRFTPAEAMFAEQMCKNAEDQAQKVVTMVMAAQNEFQDAFDNHHKAQVETLFADLTPQQKEAMVDKADDDAARGKIQNVLADKKRKQAVEDAAMEDEVGAVFGGGSRGQYGGSVVDRVYAGSK